jgi:hypothetical protein
VSVIILKRNQEKDQAEDPNLIQKEYPIKKNIGVKVDENFR